MIRVGWLDLFVEDRLLLWTQPLFLTLQLMAVSVAVAAVIGIVGAWAASNLDTTRFSGRFLVRGFVASMMIAVAMPMILHAAAWEATAGKFGWMVMTQSGARTNWFGVGASGPYGFFAGLLACGWIHGLVGAAIVALATRYGTERTPAAVIEQARMEKGPMAIWWLVRLPIAMPWVVTALMATALLAATEMTVVDLYGYRSLADEFYLFYAVDPSMMSLLLTCGLPLGLTCGTLAWLFVMRRRRRERIGFANEAPVPIDPIARKWRAGSIVIVIAVACLVMIVPVIGLLIKVGHEVTVENGQVQAVWSASACFQRLFDAPRTFSQEYSWTAIIAVATALIATVIAWPIAAFGRTQRRLERWFDLGTVMMVSLPGPVIAMAVVWLFQSDIPGFRTLYQESLVPTILTLLVRGFPVAYWILRAGYRAVDTSVLEAARMDGSIMRRIWHVDRPLMRANLLAACLASAVVASGDVPATLPVIPPGVTTVGTRLFGLLHSGARYQEAALAIWYVVAVVVISSLLLRQTMIRRVTVE